MFQQYLETQSLAKAGDILTIQTSVFIYLVYLVVDSLNLKSFCNSFLYKNRNASPKFQNFTVTHYPDISYPVWIFCLIFKASMKTGIVNSL